MLSVSQRKFQVIGILMFSTMFSRRIASRFLVRAFTTTSNNGMVARRIAAGSQFPQQRWLTSLGVAPVEEDLDTALDSLLGDAFIEAEDPLDLENEAHMKDSQPVPKKLVEEMDPINFNDPKFLSTSNPRWVEAGLSPKVIDVLSAKGITKFTPVQGEAFDPVLAGRDVIGRSRTGTGKTLAFGLPSMVRLVDLLEQKGFRDSSGQMTRGRPVSMLILCPTRELARQVQEELASVARPLGLHTEVFHGGVSYDPQNRALRQGVDIIVGTPGRVIDHINRGNLRLSKCEIAVLDEADEMLNMGFADDVETILDGLGQDNSAKAQCLLFSATTPPWVKNIGRKYQENVIAIDATGDEGGARVAKTVRHIAIQVPPGRDSKKSILEDIIAVEISKDMKSVGEESDSDSDDDEPVNEIAAAAAKKKKNTSHAMQQKIFGKTIVFTETKREADELVSGGVFKSLTAQALHGDVGQKQRDATLAAFRAGAFNVLVATDVAARGIDIQDVDLVVQFDPPRDVDTYVHRSGRTGRAGKKGVSVLMFGRQQQRDIVRIERDLSHGFKFDLAGPPSIEAALRALAKTSAVACSGVPDETSQHFKEAAIALLKDNDAEDVVARCLAAISKRTTEVLSRSLITGDLGFATVEMSNSRGRPVSPGDVMFTVGKLSRMSRGEEGEGSLIFDSDVGKIQANPETGIAFFDMGVEDAKRLVEFSKDVDAGGAAFKILAEMEIERGRDFGRGGGGGNAGGNRARRGNYGRNDNQGRGGGGGGGYQGNRRENNRGPNRSGGGGGGPNRGGGGYSDRRSDGSSSGGYSSGGGGGYSDRRNDGSSSRRNDGNSGNNRRYDNNRGNDGW
jgi:ATP-dependent RNA helicase DDX21